VTFAPSAVPWLEAQGGLDGVIAEGGAYAQGKVANTHLNFELKMVGSKGSLTGNFIMSAQMKPFSYEIGLYYAFIKCNWKSAFKNLIEKKKFEQICGKGVQHKEVIAKDNIGSSTNWIVVRKSFPLIDM